MKFYLRLVFTLVHLTTILMPKGNPMGYIKKKAPSKKKKPRIKKKK